MSSDSIEEPFKRSIPRFSPKLAAWWGGFSFAILTFAVLIASEPALAIVWDEGFTLGREERVRLWLRAWRDPPAFARTWKPPDRELVQADARKPPSAIELDTRAELLSPRVLDWFWPFAREEPHGHPPFYAIVGLVGDLLAPGWDLLPRARLGPILLFSSVSGALFAFLAARFGFPAGVLAACAWTFQPHLFAHSHYAAYDGVLTSLWIGSILFFRKWMESLEPTGEPRRRSLPWIVAFGVSLGLAADTKLTGWLLPLPFVAWSILFADRRRVWKGAIASGLIALAVVYLFNPPLWNDPLGGLERFFRSNLTRGRTIPISTLFLGRIYRTPIDSLPWYNTAVWTLFATPIGFLGFALVGLIRAARRPKTEPLATLVGSHWVMLIVLRALPHAPGHDGVRQFLPAFGCLAILAGLGGASAAKRLRASGTLLIAAACVEGAAGVAFFMPVPLSYYSPIVGGLPGATALGMEPTYYWDALTDDALERLALRAEPPAKVAFVRYPIGVLELRKLRRPLLWIRRPDQRPDLYVIQNRPGEFGETDRRLVDRFGNKKKYILISKFGVPLVWAFPIEAVESIRRELPKRGRDRR